jgi:RNA polymerase sigma-70 factor, ECF subfamily
MSELPDAALAVQYQETGDVAHLEELVSRHIGSVRRLIHSIVLNAADADELTQDVFRKVMQGIQDFNGKAQFSTWLRRITLNTTYSFLRRRKASPVETREDPPDAMDRLARPDGELVRHELAAEIEAAMASLSPKLRAAIALTALQGLDVREAARAEGCLAATMYWRIHEARRLLRRKLGHHLGHA